MTSKTIGFHEWAKQLAIWLAITTLLPLVPWFGTAAFTSEPGGAEYSRVQRRLNEELLSASSPVEKDRLRAEIDQREKQNEASERVFAKRMFYLALPVGLIAMIVGIFVPVQAVGAGLMFGGIGTLVTGCFESWEYLGPGQRLGSLISTLIITIVLGLWRFGRIQDSTRTPATAPPT